VARIPARCYIAIGFRSPSSKPVPIILIALSLLAAFSLTPRSRKSRVALFLYAIDIALTAQR